MSHDDDRKRLTKLTVKELRKQAVELLGSAAAARLKLKADLVEALTKVAKEAIKTVVETLVPVLEKATSSRPVTAPSPRPSAPSSGAAPSSAQSGNFLARDFFLNPSHKRLPTTYSDDRLLWFRREPSGVVVSWDLSPKTFSDGREISVQLRTSSGAIKSSSAIGASSGLWTIEEVSRGEALNLVVVQRGAVILTGPAVFLEGVGAGMPMQGTVSHPDGRVNQFQTQPWYDAPLPSARSDVPRVQHSSRVSS